MVNLRSNEATPLAASLPKLESLLSPYTGLVRRAQETLYDTDDATFARWDAELCDVRPLTGRTTRSAFATSVHYDRRKARAGAIGEALERYAALNVPDDLVLDTADGLGSIAADPRTFSLFSPEQYVVSGFRYRPFTCDLPVRWKAAYRLPDCTPAMLPAQLVYLTEVTTEGEAPIGYSTTSGNACGPSLEEALLGGLLELIERDAFTITWNARLSLPRFNLDRYAHNDSFERSGLRYAAIDLSCYTGVPVAAATVRDDRSGVAALTVGAAAAQSVAEAMDKAIREAFHGRSWAARMHEQDPERVARLRPEAIESFEDHILYFCDPARAQAASFFDAAPMQSGLASAYDLPDGTPFAHLLELLRRLAKCGIEVYFVDLTPGDIRDAGLHVVSVVAPRLSRLDVAYRYRYLGCDRLYELPATLGLAPRRLTFQDLNPDPHPFP